MQPTDRINLRICYEGEKMKPGADGVAHLEPFLDLNLRWPGLNYEQYHAINTLLTDALQKVNAIAAPQEAPKRPA